MQEDVKMNISSAILQLWPIKKIFITEAGLYKTTGSLR